MSKPTALITVPGHLTKANAMAIPIWDADRIWAGRMLVGEEGYRASYASYHGVLSCMIRRLAWLSVGRSVQGRRYRTLTDMMRAYSQPINPIWENRGTAEQIARRRRMRNLSWSDIPANAANAADSLLYGDSQLSVPGAEHFAAPWLVQKRLNQHPRCERVNGPPANWYCTNYGGPRGLPEPILVPGGHRPRCASKKFFQKMRAS